MSADLSCELESARENEFWCMKDLMEKISKVGGGSWKDASCCGEIPEPLILGAGDVWKGDLHGFGIADETGKEET